MIKTNNMKQVVFTTQPQAMIMGHEVMNPQQQQQRWMDTPSDDPTGLAYLRPLEALLAKQVVSMTESMD